MKCYISFSVCFQWFRPPSSFWFWTLAAAETRRKGIYDMWDHPIHGWDFGFRFSLGEKCHLWLFELHFVCFIFQHWSPTCVSLPLDSVNPVTNVMHLWCNLYGVFLLHCAAFYVFVILPFHFLSYDGSLSWSLFSRSVWTAPEVLSGGPYNHAADWWSFGIMLFSLVTGEVTTYKPNILIAQLLVIGVCV